MHVCLFFVCSLLFARFWESNQRTSKLTSTRDPSVALGVKYKRVVVGSSDPRLMIPGSCCHRRRVQGQQQQTEEERERIQAKWARLVRIVRRRARLQRIWAALGHYLRDAKKTCK